MKREEIKVGSEYVAKVSGKMVNVKVINIRSNGRPSVVYDVRNMATGRVLTFRSSMRFRKLATAPQTVSDSSTCIPFLVYRPGGQVARNTYAGVLEYLPAGAKTVRRWRGDDGKHYDDYKDANGAVLLQIEIAAGTPLPPLPQEYKNITETR